MRDDARAARDRLIRLGGERLANELASIYLEEMQRRMTTARNALHACDAVTLAGEAHGMKSSSAQLGARDLATACEAVEVAAERGDLAAAAQCFADVESQFAAFGSWLAEHASMDWRGSGRASATPAKAPNRELAIIAVIEDNVDNRLLLDAILGDDFSIHEYATGAEALAKMPTDLPDLVLLDVSLPGMDGLEVLARMRRDHALREVPVVAVTAHAMAGDRERYLAAGFDGYVPKPIVDERSMIDTIVALLARRPPSSRRT